MNIQTGINITVWKYEEDRDAEYCDDSCCFNLHGYCALFKEYLDKDQDWSDTRGCATFERDNTCKKCFDL